uniref:Uncharacterized protein n=1 Tax=Arundo donax TaxID=35708 RepID=A0A0A9F525_ARUDO
MLHVSNEHVPACNLQQHQQRMQREWARVRT